MNELFPDTLPPSLGVITAGGVKMTYRGTVLDLMGLNHVAMAHERGERRGKKNHAAFSKPVFYEMSPEIVVPRLTPGPPEQDTLLWSYADELLQNIFHDPRFRSAYSFAALRREGQRGSWICGYFRNGLLERLVGNPAYQVLRVETPK